MNSLYIKEIQLKDEVRVCFNCDQVCSVFNIKNKRNKMLKC